MRQREPDDTTQGVSRNLLSSIAAVAGFFGDLTDSELMAAADGAWAPLDDLVHLHLCAVPVAKAIRTPKVLLAVRFGLSGRTSESYEALGVRYQKKLAAGLTSKPRYVPPVREDRDPGPYRDELLARLTDVGDRMTGTLDGWSVEALDRYQLPHPGLGKLTVREIIYFTEIHNLHHVEVAKRRLGRRDGRGPEGRPPKE